jgi:hypothetical protein
MQGEGDLYIEVGEPDQGGAMLLDEARQQHGSEVQHA